ncbi:MAG: hypothetical protein ACP5I3_11670 [Thermoproteus sp.]
MRAHRPRLSDDISFSYSTLSVVPSHHLLSFYSLFNLSVSGLPGAV